VSYDVATIAAWPKACREIADVVGMLADPVTGYVTGQVLVACGGRSIAP
jgi:hypothetical protein